MTAEERRRLEQLRDNVAMPEKFDPEGARRELIELVGSLDRDNYYGPAAAISRYLLGECTLEQAFGLAEIRKRGAPKKNRDDQMRQVFELRLRPKPTTWKKIRRAVGWKGHERELRRAYKEALSELMAAELVRRLG